MSLIQPYIDQLLEDIIKAERQENVQPTFSTAQPQTIEDDFVEIERWLEHEPVHTFSYYCGLEQVQFPPAEKLTKKQLLQITKAFKHLLFTWNLDADIPKKVPLNKRYTFLIRVLNEKTDIVNSGFMTFEFCTCDPPSCPFEEHCTCKDFDFYTNDDVKTDLQEGDLPF